MDPLLGSITLFAGSYAPRGWSFCDGSLLQINQYNALYAVIGNVYGGDGRATFAVPDLRGRVPVQQGTGPGLTNRVFANAGGEETVTLTVTQMPSHSHSLKASSAPGTLPSPENNVLSISDDPDASGHPLNFTTPANANILMAPQVIASAGNSQPHDNMPPFLAINYIIAVEGVFPTRN